MSKAGSDHILTRRNVLKTVGVSAMLAPLNPNPLQSYENNPDKELLTLGRELEAAHADLEQALHENSEASDRYEAVCPARPVDTREKPKLPAEYADFEDIRHGEMEIIQKMAPNHPVAVWGRKIDELHRTMSEKERQWLETTERLALETGLRDAEEKFSNCNQHCWNLTEKIYSLPAQTVEGMLVKVLALDMLDASADMDSEFTKIKPWASVAGDIKALARQNAVA